MESMPGWSREDSDTVAYNAIREVTAVVDWFLVQRRISEVPHESRSSSILFRSI